jgi:hypothetical protein
LGLFSSYYPSSLLNPLLSGALSRATGKMASRDPVEAAETANVSRLSDEITATSRDLDENYEFFKVRSEVEATEAEVKKVLRKIDYRVVPILFVIYFLQYLDKNAINFANAYGLQEGTHLHGQDFSWLGM